MTPKSDMSKVFRNAVLDLARDYAFARPLVNSGRLSVPCVYDGFAHFGEDALGGPAETCPGAACTDARFGDGYLLDHLTGAFQLLFVGCAAPEDVALEVVEVAAPSVEMRARYLGDAKAAVYLIRPDQHVVARWSEYDAKRVDAALKTALGKD